MCSLSSREVLRTINNSVWAHVGEMHNHSFSWHCRWKTVEVWTWTWWSAVNRLMERHFLKSHLNPKGSSGDIERQLVVGKCRASMCLSCVSTFTDSPPIRRHSTPQLACSLCALLTEHEACSLPVLQGEELRLGEGTYSIHSSCCRIMGYSPLLWDRCSKCMLT